MTYLINFLLVPFYYVIIREVAGKSKCKKWFFLVVTIHAILFRALANPYIYVDTEGYADAFRNISTMSLKEAILSPNYYTSWGVGYIFINWLISKFTLETTHMFIFMSVVSVGGVILYYYKSSYAYLTAVLFYLLYPMLYMMGFGVIRQHLSVMFILWALYYFDNLKISIPFFVASALCHTSGLIFLPFYFFKYISINKITSVKYIIIILVSLFLFRSTITYVLPYLDRYEWAYYSDEGSNNYMPVVLIGSILLFFFLTNIFKRITDQRDINVVRFIAYGFIVSLFSIGVHGAGRLTMCFLYTLPVAIGLPYKYGKKKVKQEMNLYMVMLFALTLFMVYHALFKYQIYIFFWEGIKY